MDELEQTADQPQEATTTAAEPAQPFWDKMDDEAATETPEPNAEAESEEPEPEATDAEAENTDEEDSDWLPTEQEKVFPAEILAKYAKRYGKTMEQLQADPQLKQLILDKINSDVLIKQHSDAANQEQEEEGEEEEPTLEPASTQPVPQDRAQWLEQVVASNLDAKAISQFGHNFLVACGVDPNEPDSKGILENSAKVGGELAKAAVDIFSTIGPQLQMEQLEQNMPGITEMYQRSLYGQQWEHVSAEADANGKPLYANLPVYGSPEFKTAIQAAAAQFPGFEQMVFNGANGRPLPAHQQIEKQYSLLAKYMSGQKVTPQEVAKAINTGKQQVKDADRSRAAGKVLGAGQSKKQLANADTGDDFKSMISDYNAKQRSTPMKG